MIRPDGTGFTQLTSDHNSAWGSWTPDGSHIIYSHNLGLWAMERDGSNARPISQALGDLLHLLGLQYAGAIASGMHASWQPQP